MFLMGEYLMECFLTADFLTAILVIGNWIKLKTVIRCLHFVKN